MLANLANERCDMRKFVIVAFTVLAVGGTAWAGTALASPSATSPVDPGPRFCPPSNQFCHDGAVRQIKGPYSSLDNCQIMGQNAADERNLESATRPDVANKCAYSDGSWVAPNGQRLPEGDYSVLQDQRTTQS